MKSTIPIIVVATAVLTGCGERDKENEAAGKEAERESLLEYQRRDNVERQTDRYQSAVETVF